MNENENDWNSQAGVIVSRSPAQMGSELLKEMTRLGLVN